MRERLITDGLFERNVLSIQWVVGMKLHYFLRGANEF